MMFALQRVYPWLSRLLLSLALGWAAYSLLREATAGVRSLAEPPSSGPVINWRLGSRPAERLHRCLQEAHRLVSPDPFVTFVSPPGAIDAEFLRWRWAAYFLPDLDVVRLSDGAPGYVIAFQMRLDRPTMTLVRELPGGGWLYRRNGW
jgi:hypothetical protein